MLLLLYLYRNFRLESVVNRTRVITHAVNVASTASAICRQTSQPYKMHTLLFIACVVYVYIRVARYYYISMHVLCTCSIRVAMTTVTVTFLKRKFPHLDFSS